MDKYESTFNTWNKVALLYQEKFMELELYNDSYNDFCKLLPSSAKILEIGCGPGNITRYLLQKDPGYKITGLDVAPAMLELARINNPAAVFIEMDCRKLEEIKEKFDGLMCGFCLPYLSKEDVEKLLSDATRLMEEGGIIYLSYIEAAYEHSGFEAGSTGDESYVYYHQEDFIEQLLKNNDLIIEKSIKQAYPTNDNNKQVHTIFIAQKIL
jgi:ubiquinone/menaquinone biosynthesis C-methylase UbiE